MRNALIRLGGVLLAAAALVVPLAGSASAADRHRPANSAAELQAQVDAQLALHPGGKQISRNEVRYALPNGGTFEIAFPLPGVRPAAVHLCPSGSFCFWDGPNFSGARGKLSDHGWQDLATWSWQDRTDSIDNNTDSYVKFINHGGGTSHAGDALVICVQARGIVAELGSKANIIDHVDRGYSAGCP